MFHIKHIKLRIKIVSKNSSFANKQMYLDFHVKKNVNASTLP